MIVCGVSGSGKSTALNVLEDMGYDCLDNLPEPLLGEFSKYVVEELSREGNADKKFGLLVNFSNKPAFDLLQKAIDYFEEKKVQVALLYFDAQDYVLKRRFKETRRPHPLLLKEKSHTSLARALETERELLSEFRLKADKVFDSSFYTPHDLKRNLEDYFSFSRSLLVRIVSFGFKYGSPQDADLVVDVRFLPNPHFVPELRPRTGLEKPVQDYVFSNKDGEEFLKIYCGFLEFVLPRYKNEGKHYVTLGIGCTGGKHRSVTLSEHLVELIPKLGFSAEVTHRDLTKVS